VDFHYFSREIGEKRIFVMTFSSSVVKRIFFFGSAIAIFVTSNILLAQTDLQLNYTFFSEDFKAPNFIETAEYLNFTQDDDDDIESIIDVSKFSEAKYQNSSLKEANKVLIDETNQRSEDNNRNSPNILPYPISMLQDIEDPLEASDVAFFWYVYKLHSFFSYFPGHGRTLHHMY